MSLGPTHGRNLVPGPDRLVRRRALLGAGVLAVGAGAAGESLVRVVPRGNPRVPLYSAAVGVGATGERTMLAPEELLPAAPSRVLDDPGRDSEVALAEESLLADVDRLEVEGRADPRWRELLATSLLDLNALSHGLPAPVAAWSGPWRYVWPRDAAHVCRTMAALGRPEEVLAWLGFLAGVQREDGHFEARYTLLGGVPDDRPMQADGVGWFLWAVQQCADLALTPEHRAELLALAGPAAGAALRAVYRDLDRTGGLPTATPDYWEVHERRTTLGIAALTLAGLQSAARLGEGLCPEAGRAQRYADRLRDDVVRLFGRRGYQRYVRGGGHDAAITFLIPPYVSGLEDEVAPLLTTAWREMRRPAGGVAPGAGWREDGISWTPETALFGQAWAELGETTRAKDVLAWLEAHRTPAGSLPEKVLADGSPAAVAPLAWTCALTASTILHPALAPPG